MKSDHGKIIDRLQTQIEMLTEINDNYQGKVAELKEHGCGKSDEIAAKDQQLAGLRELNEQLKHEVEVLKANHTWLKKDNAFKTE